MPQKTRSLRTPTFKKLFDSLPVKIQQTAKAKYELFKQDPNHPVLKTHKLHGKHKDKFAISTNREYRAIYKIEDRLDVKVYIWLWIESHSDYDKVLR